MKVLVVGGGAREHAICWKISQSNKLTKLYVAPGNPGMKEFAECLPIKDSDITALKDFALQEKIDLTIVGPELPLSLGIVDVFENAGLKIFGPSQAAARIEGSKSFAKEIMTAAIVPTATYQEFIELQPLKDYLTANNKPIVLKADGLAAGKGVFVCQTQAEALEAADKLFTDFQAKKVVAEEFLKGVEASFIVAVDGRRIVPMASSHDYKPIFDDNLGPNTGGMGTVSPTPRLSRAQEDEVLVQVIVPVVKELERRGIYYRGFLYAGLMIAEDGTINILEFNARLGDPETQVILRRMDSDFLHLLEILTNGDELPEMKWHDHSAVCVVMASHGYPEKVRTGDSIEGLDKIKDHQDVAVFHAGTSHQDDKLVTAGGRVLSITAIGNDLQTAREKAYQALGKISFQGSQYRKDIGIF